MTYRAREGTGSRDFETRFCTPGHAVLDATRRRLKVARAVVGQLLLVWRSRRCGPSLLDITVRAATMDPMADHTR